jgi:hypothetical protein
MYGSLYTSQVATRTYSLFTSFYRSKLGRPTYALWYRLRCKLWSSPVSVSDLKLIAF